ncbi:hypothetical protein NKF51_04585 [Candidatus Liberibacter asiaticus]|uniref:hypothetical protein n=1 Tax=Liberibacter asiaticus TaxID=34021 RepID=UPI00234B2E43|nr:hypothetical protein [Candidatus Liberibacter asiaticus]WCM57251.1 hypothetical protein NKF51_04585 [Candidatus Liberibacter asiaticus]
MTKSKVSPAYRFMFASNDNCKNFVRYVACVDAYSVEIVAGKFLKRAAVLMWVAPFASLGVAVLSRYLRDGVFNLDSLLVDFSVSLKEHFFDTYSIPWHSIFYFVSENSKEYCKK